MSIASFAKLSFIAFAASILYCTVSPVEKSVSGPGIGVLSGKLVNIQGKPAIGAVVNVVPVEYVPSLGHTALTDVDACTTDSKGEYRIYSLESHYYNFEARSGDIGVFRDSIKVIQDSQEHRLDDMTLSSLGRVTGVTKMPGQNDTNQVRVTLYFVGTRRITKPAIGGAFAFDQVPAGNYQLIIDPTLNSYNVRILNIHLDPGQQLDLDTLLLGVYEPDTITINQTSVSGTWGPGKVYNINSSITVPKGATLTICPGTTLRFLGMISITACGPIFAVGNSDSLIRFSSAAGANSPWNGIRVVDQYDSLLLSYCIVEHAFFGLSNSWSPSKTEIRNCVFRYCGNAFVAETFTNEGYTFHNTVFHNNGTNAGYYAQTFGGIYAMGPSNQRNEAWFNIVDCIFADNRMAFMYVGDSMTVHTRNTCYYQNGIDFAQVHFPDTTISTFTNNVDDSASTRLDPLFISLEAGKEDYHLQAGSPCRGAGTNGTDIGLYGTH